MGNGKGKMGKADEIKTENGAEVNVSKHGALATSLSMFTIAFSEQQCSYLPVLWRCSGLFQISQQQKKVGI